MNGIEWISEPARFAAIDGEWDRLARVSGETPFDRHAWYAAWWEAFGASGRLLVGALWSGGELAAVLPSCGRLGRLESMASVHTPASRPLARDPEALSELLDGAICAAPGEFDLSALPSDEPALGLLRAASARRGRRVLVQNQHLSPITDTSGDYAEYRRRMKAHWREVERRRRKLERERERRTTLTLLARPDDLEQALDAMFAVEASGWKGRGGTAIASSASTLAFYRAVARVFHATGELRLSFLQVDGEIAAIDLALLVGGRYFLLKTGYDENLRRFSPGLVLRLAVVEQCFEEGVVAHEFLGDDLPWKRLFATHERSHVTVRVYRRGPVASARYGYRRALRPALREVYARLVRHPPVPGPAPELPSPPEAEGPPVPPVGQRG